MKRCAASALLVATCLAVGLFGTTALQAQPPTAAKRPAYYISEFQVNDAEGIKPYSAQVASTFRPFSGRYIVRGGPIAALEGQSPQGRIVVIEFDGMAQAQAWYDSPDYRALRPIRHRSATSRVFIVEGTPAKDKP